MPHSNPPSEKSAGTPEVIPNATLHLLRRQIVAGQFAPGERLPTRRVLQDTLGVSPVTLQRALDRLQKEGFVRSVDRVGSYITQRPPHLYRCPVVFPSSPRSQVGNWNRFWQLMVNTIPDVAEKTNRKLPIYLNIDGHADNEDFQTLVRDVQLRRLAGLIFATKPWPLEHTPLLTEPGIPRVAITFNANNMHVVAHDFRSFFARAVEYLAQRGRKRVAVLVREGMLSGWQVNVEELMHRHGLATRPEWTQIVMGLENARTVLHLLMSSRNRERPDGVILADDNWMDHATAGLIAAGVRVPEDLDVVTHCNFPQPEPRVMPFKRLGWDVRHVLEACVEVLDAIRRGENPPLERRMAAVFDHELESE